MEEYFMQNKEDRYVTFIKHEFKLHSITFSSFSVEMSWANTSFLTLSIGSRSYNHSSHTQKNNEFLNLIKQQGYLMLVIVIYLSNTTNLITCTVCAARIRHGVAMVSVCVHFKNLEIIVKRERPIIIWQRVTFDN
jgi:hypothetical protein